MLVWMESLRRGPMNPVSTLKPWLVLAVTLVIAIAAGGYVMRQQWLAAKDRAQSDAENEIALLAALLQTDLEGGQFQSITELFQRWGGMHSDVVALRLILANGLVVSEYRRSASAELSVSTEKAVRTLSQGNARMVLTKDLAAVADRWSRILWQFGGLFGGVAILLVLLTRSWVLRQRQINALSDLQARLEQARQSEAERNRLISILEATTDLVSTADLRGNISYLNRAGRDMIGVGDKSLASLQIPDIHPDWASQLILNEGIPTAKRTGAWSGQTAVLGPGGQEIPVSQVILSHNDEQGRLSFLSTVMRDVSERQRSERVMLRHNRLLKTLAGLNAMMMLDQEEDLLMEQICRMLVEESQFRMAWIGLLEPDGVAVRPVAYAGFEDGYLHDIDIRCDESPQGYGPTGSAIRLGQTIINPITEANQTFSPWRESALERGFSSSAATPIKQQGRVIGTISVYSGEPDAFGTEEVLLLERLASELGFALEYRSSEQTRRKLVSIVNHSRDFIAIADMEGRLQFVNQAGMALLGLNRDLGEQGRHLSDLINGPRHDLLTTEVMPVLQTAGHWSGEMSLRNFATGTAVPMLGDVFVVSDQNGRQLNLAMVSRDISERKCAEEALRISEERLRQAVRVSHLGIFDHDHPADTIFWSSELRRILGWEESENVSLPMFLDQVVAEDREIIAAAIRHTHDPSGDGVYDVDYRILRRDGEMRWLAALGQTFFEGSGLARHPLRTVGAVIDITDRKRAEEALRQSEERLRQAVRVSQIGIFDHDHLADTVYWSLEKRKIHGWSADEDIRLPAFLNSVHPEDRAAIEAAVRRAHDPSGDGIYDAEYRIIRRDGEIRWLVALGQTFFAGNDGERHPTRTVGAAIDITERKHTEQALREYQERLEELVAERTQKIQEQANIIDQIHDSVITTDLEGVIQSWNGGAERLFGYTAAEAVGRHIGFVYPENEQNFLRDQVITPLKSKGAHESEAHLRRKNGEDFFVHLSLSLLLDEHGAPRGMVGYAMDITERKRAESRLRQQTQELALLNQELQAFSYSVSHDLRAPLRGIDGFSQALLEDYSDKLDDTGKEYLQRVRSGTLRMAQLIDDLLKLSRVTRAKVSPTWVDLSVMVDEIVRQLQRNEVERQVAVTIAAGLEAWGDSGLLRVALENLLNNAWKYTGKKPHAQIEFGQRIENQEVVYFLRDNGAGFDMKYADKLFGAFQRLHRTSEFPGTGIGLATVQRIIHRHGGRIWAFAEEGKGATFSFVLGPGPAVPIKKN